VPDPGEHGAVDDGDDLSEGMTQRVQALIDAGWVLAYTESDQSWQYGNSMFWGLERDRVTIELEYYDHGQLVAYPVSERDPADELAEPYFSITKSTVESSRAAFAAQRWL